MWANRKAVHFARHHPVIGSSEAQPKRANTPFSRACMPSCNIYFYLFFWGMRAGQNSYLLLPDSQPEQANTPLGRATMHAEVCDWGPL